MNVYTEGLRGLLLILGFGCAFFLFMRLSAAISKLIRFCFSSAHRCEQYLYLSLNARNSFPQLQQDFLIPDVALFLHPSLQYLALPNFEKNSKPHIRHFTQAERSRFASLSFARFFLKICLHKSPQNLCDDLRPTFSKVRPHCTHFRML